MKKHFRTYQELNEALKLSQYRDYHDIRPYDVEQKLNYRFGGKNRIYIPFNFKISVDEVQEDWNVRIFLKDNGYVITNYLEGYCEKDGRTFRIGKILNKLNRLDLLKIFNEDPQRAIQNKKLLICISKHPYDIAGMSTDRGWTSCMDISKSHMDSYIEYEIKEGTVIAYLINEDDKNINHPYGRINIKPYIGKNDKRYMAWGLAEKCYGSFLSTARNRLSVKFINAVQRYVDEKLNVVLGGNDKFTLSKKVYGEAPDSITFRYRDLKKWGMQNSKLRKGVYNDDIFPPDNIVQFKGFEEELGLEINKIKGDLSFLNLYDITSVSNLPYVIDGNLVFSGCESLTSVSNLPEYVEGNIDTAKCPFFEGMNEHEIRQKYKIEPLNAVILRKFGIYLRYLKKNVYVDDIKIEYGVKEFRGFKEELGLDIKKVEGNFYFIPDDILTSVSNLPKIISGGVSFTESTSLTSISNLPDYVGKSLHFRDCKSLKFISNLPYYVGENLSFYGCNSLTSISNLPKILKYDLSFTGCTSLKSLPNLPKTIGRDLSFENCESLTSISNLPEYIGGHLSFEDCTSLSSVSNLPKTIHDGLSFDGCTSLKSLPNLPKTIGRDLSFWGCFSLTSILKMPSVVEGSIYTNDCPFFEGMNEKQIREKYNISR